MGIPKKRSKRKNINVSTLDKVKEFLKNQDAPVSRSEIRNSTGVDYDSVGVALEMLNVRINKDGKVKLKC